MKDIIHLHDHAADPHIVRQFTKYLITAFEQFIHTYPGEIDYIDGLMAAHNFHKRIVLHLEHETEDTAGIWRSMALATFENALRQPDANGDME